MTGDIKTTPNEITDIGQPEAEIQSENVAIGLPKMPTLKIDEEFQFLIPPLSREEYDQLVHNIEEYGCIDPIVLWDGHDIILDGHNRYTICTEKGFEFKTHPIKFNTREGAINWIIDNQLGRRNLTESQMSYLRGKKYNTEKKVAHRPEKGDQSDHLKTADKIAQEHNVGSATVRRDAKFATALDSLKEDVGEDFGKKLLSEEIKLPKRDVIKLAGKPIEEKKALADEIQKGPTRLSQAEVALQTVNETRMEIFAKAGPEIDFAGWCWDPHKLDAPKNTPAILRGSQPKQRLVYLNEDIFGEGFNEDDRKKIIQVMEESPQWAFMVHTSELEQLAEIHLPENVWIGCIVDSSKCQGRFEEVIDNIGNKIESSVKFMIIDIHNLREDPFKIFGFAKFFNWFIVRDLSKCQRLWAYVVFLLAELMCLVLNDKREEIQICVMPNVNMKIIQYPTELLHQFAYCIDGNTVEQEY